MEISNETLTKGQTISKAALADGDKTAGEAAGPYQAIDMLSMACAMLTSTIKAEREEGKTWVRRWKNGNSF